MSELQNLHDATLTQISLDWATGDFIAKFIVGSDRREIRITGDGLKSFVFSRDFPWGRSVSVNKCQIETRESGAVLTIEMQSGDELVGNAANFVVFL